MIMRRIQWSDDSGIAMMMAIGFMMTMSVIVAAATAYAVNVIPQTQQGLAYTRALAAAQAGIDHYLGHLNTDRNYFETFDCDNVALEGPNPDPGLADNACGYTSGTPYGWVAMSTADPSNGEFHYDVDTSDMDQYTIWLTSTGRADGTERSLQAKISIAGSQRYLYVTDFEDADPENQVAYSTTGGGEQHCGSEGVTLAKYWYSVDPNTRRNDGDCVEIQFITADVLDGPVHFNDMPLVNGNTQFRQGFTTYSPECPKTPVTTRAAAVNRCFRGGGTPSLSTRGARWANFNALPDTTGDLVNKPGCHYTGDTRIRFNSNGTMDVWNTRSAGTTLASVGQPTPVVDTAPDCGNAAQFTAVGGGKYPAAKQTVPVPDGMVIYVKPADTSAPCVPGQVVNGTTSGSTNGDHIPLGTSYATTATNSQVTDIAYRPPNWRKTRVSNSWPSTPTGSGTYPTKNNCGGGNVYIEGTVKGSVTIAAENNVYVTGDLLLEGVAAGANPSRENSNIVGLVAQNSVIVYHPVQVSSWTTRESPTNNSFTCPVRPTDPGPSSGGSNGQYCEWTPNGYSNLTYPAITASNGQRWIYASIQTLAHSFWVASYHEGNPTGYLRVRGSIAQRWRGIVGQGSINNGYIKDYKYDQRLQTTSPPYFPPWANGEWAAETTGEVDSPVD